MARKALLIGLSYPGTPYELQCSLNDVTKLKDCLIENCDFKSDDITVLLDDNGEINATLIQEHLAKLIAYATAGDSLLVYFSGHGNHLKSTMYDNHSGHIEYIIASIDGDGGTYVRDTDFRHQVEQVPKGCGFTMLIDACSSGGILEGSPEQIGYSCNSPAIFGISAPKDPGFGDPTGRPLGVLVSACQNLDQAYWKYIEEWNGYGSDFTHALIKVLSGNKGKITYQKLVKKIKKLLDKEGRGQYPGLYCADTQKNMRFLSPG